MQSGRQEPVYGQSLPPTCSKPLDDTEAKLRHPEKKRVVEAPPEWETSRALKHAVERKEAPEEEP